MSRYRNRYRRKDTYYTQLQVAGWIDLFTRKQYSKRITDSMKWSIENRGLRVYEYVLMPSHLTMIVNTAWGSLPDVLSGFEKFTSQAIIRMLRNGYKDPRKTWILNMVNEYGEPFPDGILNIWRKNVGTEPILREKQAEDRVAYIHRLPVEAGLVERPDQYLYSSANPGNPLGGWLMEATD